MLYLKDFLSNINFLYISRMEILCRIFYFLSPKLSNLYFWSVFKFPTNIDRHRHKNTLKYLLTEKKIKNENSDFFHGILSLLGQFRDISLYLEFPDIFLLKNWIGHMKKWVFFFYFIFKERGKE